jgi:hypothetical protein
MPQVQPKRYKDVSRIIPSLPAVIISRRRSGSGATIDDDNNDDVLKEGAHKLVIYCTCTDPSSSLGTVLYSTVQRSIRVSTLLLTYEFHTQPFEAKRRAPFSFCGKYVWYKVCTKAGIDRSIDPTNSYINMDPTGRREEWLDPMSWAMAISQVRDPLEWNEIMIPANSLVQCSSAVIFLLWQETCHTIRVLGMSLVYEEIDGDQTTISEQFSMESVLGRID